MGQDAARHRHVRVGAASVVDAFPGGALLVFLAFFVLFHFRRQQRNLLEAEQNRQPSAAEAEFGIVVDSEGKEVKP